MALATPVLGELHVEAERRDDLQRALEMSRADSMRMLPPDADVDVLRVAEQDDRLVAARAEVLGNSGMGCTGTPE